MKGLIVGVANEHSIAWGCARVLRQAGAEIALTYQNDKAKPYVEPLAKQLQSPIFLPLDVTSEAQMDALFTSIEKHWGQLDFLIHAIAYAPKSDLQGRVVDCSVDGFLMAMDISCHSFIRLAKRAEPLMQQGGSLITMSYYGSEKVVQNYNLMGPVKAALEACVRYLAVELGSKHIRVNAISPGPIKTRAASGLAHFDELLLKAAEQAPLHQIVDIDAVGKLAGFLVSDQACSITGQILYVDGGYHICD